MKRHTLSLSILAFVLGCLVVVAPAVAVPPPRTFVAPDGVDTNPCSLTMPCRSFGAAVNAVAAGGEVVALGSAGYGTVELFKSVSIIAPAGVYAGVYDSGAALLGAVYVGGTKTVLRGLTINGSGGGRGIYHSSGVLHVENCTITGFDTGIDSSGPIFIEDSFLRANDTGISIYGGKGSVDHVRTEDSRIGMRIDAGSFSTVRDSVSAGNETGFFAFVGHGPQPLLTLENCMVVNNATGISEGGSLVVMSNCTVTGNSTVGVTGSGGIIYSRKNNTVIGNLLDVDATITPLTGI